MSSSLSFRSTTSRGRGRRAAWLVIAAIWAGCATTTSDDQILEDIRDTSKIPLLGSYDETEQRDAVNSYLLGLDRAPDVVSNILAESLRDPVYDDRTKLVIATLLGTVQDQRAIGTLVGFLGTTNDNARQHVKEALLGYGSRIVPSVGEALETGDGTTRLLAAEVLVELALPDTFEAMHRRLS